MFSSDEDANGTGTDIDDRKINAFTKKMVNKVTKSTHGASPNHPAKTPTAQKSNNHLRGILKRGTP